ncbi:MAG: hypothetical protein A2X86_00500 [Bdellovibrionales bacterium GWA2_49_15]|nr:MAG: hypothetical protein A2X86_00500 [Bdellovibrionales bacterium GWA2_49_15]HAZ13254.1 hypothetical protein [Bdellovibrionales bacterium]
MKSEIQQKLEQLAFDRTIPFCYGCYIKAPKGVCPGCRSDDLMRHLEGVGCEYGTDWIIKHILEEELTPVHIDEAFEDSIRSCYPEETQVGWMTFDTVELMKSQDPLSWKFARDEYESELESDEQIISFDNGATYYWGHDLETLVE